MEELQQALALLDTDYILGRTYFEEEDKKYMLDSYYSSTLDINADLVAEEKRNVLPSFHGASIREVVNKALEHFNCDKLPTYDKDTRIDELEEHNFDLGLELSDTYTEIEKLKEQKYRQEVEIEALYKIISNIKNNG